MLQASARALGCLLKARRSISPVIYAMSMRQSAKQFGLKMRSQARNTCCLQIISIEWQLAETGRRFASPLVNLNNAGRELRLQ